MIRPQTQAHIFITAMLWVVCSSPASAADFYTPAGPPDAPPGYAWRFFESIKARFLVPDGWFAAEFEDGPADVVVIAGHDGFARHSRYGAMRASSVPWACMIISQTSRTAPWPPRDRLT